MQMLKKSKTSHKIYIMHRTVTASVKDWLQFMASYFTLTSDSEFQYEIKVNTVNDIFSKFSFFQ